MHFIEGQYILAYLDMKYTYIYVTKTVSFI